MSRRLVSVLVWSLATAAAVLTAWAAVRPVTDGLLDPSPIGLAEVGAAPADVAAPVSSTSPAPEVPAATPTSAPDAPDAPVRSYELVAGTVTVRFSPERVELVSVTPAPGAAVTDIDQRAATDLEVELEAADGVRSRLRAWWDGGPRQRIDERD